MLNHKLGWIPDYFDINDYSENTPLIKTMISHLNISKDRIAVNLPGLVDLRRWCTPIKDQSGANSASCEAIASLVEYFENKSSNRYVSGSRLFIYKNARTLYGIKDDDGTSLRASIKSLIQFGMPPERYYPQNEKEINSEPDAFCYGFKGIYSDLKYFKLDITSSSTVDLLNRIKEYLSCNIPCILGFSVYDTIETSESSGEITVPSKVNHLIGGHAVMAVGYDDKYYIVDNFSGTTTMGALIIKNSWGQEWGQDGFGYLPYEYVLNGLAKDFWCILKEDWLKKKI